MKKIIFLVTILFTASMLVHNASAQMAGANSWMSNVVVATAANLVVGAPRVADTNIQKVVTNFGGAFTAVLSATCQKGAFAGTNFLISFTNKGNASSVWTFKSVFTNQSSVGPYWDWGIGVAAHAGTKIIANQTLTVGQVFNMYVWISNKAVPPDGATFSLRLMATNFYNPQYTTTKWTNYTGDNGTLYGGSIGESYLESAANPLVDSWPGCVFIENLGSPLNGQLTLKIATPILSVTKILASMSLGGVVQAYAIPGTKLVYSIFVTNTGSGTAQNMNVRDIVPTSYVSNFAVIAVTNVALNATTSTIDDGSGPLAIWTNGLFGSKARAKVVFSVIVK